MVDGIVYDEETVMCPAVGSYFYWRVLRVMAVKVLTQRAAHGRRIYDRRHTFPTFVKLTEDSVIDIIVNHDNCQS